MGVQFRPKMEFLEVREVPAAFSFQLPDGSIGSGQFSEPEGVDPAQPSQSFVRDGQLTVTKSGVVYTVQPGATADYANGVLVGVTGTATGPDVINLNGPTVTVGSYSAPVTFDGADTMLSFTLSDGTVGAISYDIPWDDVDLAAASDSVSPLNFRLNIAGQNIDYPSGSFTTPPALHFEDGEFTGLTFAATGLPGSYSAFSAMIDTNGDNLLTATKVGVGPLLPSLIVAEQPQVALYFNTGANDTKDTVIPTGTLIRVQVKAGTFVYDFTYTTVAGQTVGNIAQMVFQNMKTANWNVTLSSDGRSVIVDGRWDALGPNQPRFTRDVTQAGIYYSTPAQPVGPGAHGGVQLMIWMGPIEGWQPKP
ncbi:MAG: hypothetical protein L0241_28790 [Planctomycetia bacterium]|nr:hypothetical protein [Planctomycetia bacterium]